MDQITVPNSAAITLQVPEPQYLLRILDTKQEPIASVQADGTVTVHRAGADPEAARVFWQNISQHGADLHDRLLELQTKFDALRKNHEQMLQAHADLQRQYHGLIQSRAAAAAGRMN